MRIAIVDDEVMDCQGLMNLLKRYGIAHHLAADVVCYSSAEEFFTFFAPESFQLVFMDIYLDQMNGMDAARKIYREDPSCRIIFFTTSQTHAVESYDVRAAWYLVKPVEYHRLETALDTVCADLLQDHRQITVHSAGLEVSILLKDIQFLDCSNQHTRLHLQNQIIVTEERARDLISKLDCEDRFLSCNRNIVVNMDWIEQVLDSDFLMKNGQAVPIRQRGRAAIKRSYLAWSLKELRKGAD